MNKASRGAVHRFCMEAGALSYRREGGGPAYDAYGEEIDETPARDAALLSGIAAMIQLLDEAIQELGQVNVSLGILTRRPYTRR